jgi:serine/threonine protein kinase
VINSQRCETNLTGTVLEGAYHLTRLIGEGGMGVVYEAIQLRQNKQVAIKLMTRELAENQDALARFRREAQITSHLGHPHLVNVIDFGMAESGEPYLVMEYLHGEDLDHRLRRVSRMPMATAVYVTRQIASALGAAHAQGIVHRDLKPANVFLVQSAYEPDFVKVLDFGISKMKTARTRWTRISPVIGSPTYMSPEQATGVIDDIDSRADQWALACIAWEMLAGRPPFWSEDMGAIFYQIINLNPFPLAKVAPNLPPELEPVLLRALCKEPSERFPSIRDFARAIETAAFGRPADATPAPIFTPTPLLLSRGPDIDSTCDETTQVIFPQKRVTHTVEILKSEPTPALSAIPIVMSRLNSDEQTAPYVRRSYLQPSLILASVIGILLILIGVLKLQSSELPASVQAGNQSEAANRMAEVIALPASAVVPSVPPNPPSQSAQPNQPRSAKAKRPGKANPQGITLENADPFETALTEKANLQKTDSTDPFEGKP